MQLVISFIQKDNRTGLGLILDHTLSFHFPYGYSLLSFKCLTKHTITWPAIKNRKTGDIFLGKLMCSVRNKRCIPPPVVSRSVSLPFNKSLVSSPLHNDKLPSNLSIYDPAQSQSLISFKVRKCTRPADNLGISGVTLTESVIDLRKSLQDTTTWYQRNL